VLVLLGGLPDCPSSAIGTVAAAIACWVDPGMRACYAWLPIAFFKIIIRRLKLTGRDDHDPAVSLDNTVSRLPTSNDNHAAHAALQGSPRCQETDGTDLGDFAILAAPTSVNDPHELSRSRFSGLRAGGDLGDFGRWDFLVCRDLDDVIPCLTNWHGHQLQRCPWEPPNRHVPNGDD
jgi:hypothetical protein